MADSNLTTLERVHDLTVAVASIADPSEAIAWLTERAASAIEGDATAVYIWNAPSGQLRLSHTGGLPLPDLLESVAPGEDLAGLAFARGKTVVVEPGAPDEDRPSGRLPAGAQAAIAVPLRSADHISGVLIVYYAHRQEPLPHHWVQALGLLAAQLSASVLAAAAQESALKAATTMAFRTNTSRVFANALDLETTMELVGRLAVPELADWCTIDLLTPDGTVDWLALVHGDPDKVDLERELLRRHPPRLVEAAGVAVTLRTGEAIQYVSSGALGPHSTLIMPLRANGNLLGALSLKRIGADRPYEASERADLAEHLATRCSQALLNARVYHAAQQEIAEHRRTEVALRESQGRTAAILEAALDSIITFNLSGRITEFNSAAERTFGLVRATALGQPFTSVVVVAADNDTPGTPIPGSPRRDVQLRHSDGTLRWAVISTSPLLGAHGDRVGTVAMITDITERKDAEAAVQGAEERNRLALQAAGMGTWDVDVVHDVHTWSIQAEALAGLAPGAFESTYAAFLRAVHPDDLAALKAEEHAAQEERRDSVTTYRCIWPDGTIRWIEAKGRSLYAVDGTLLRVTGTSTDVTDRREAEEALRANEERFRKQYKGFPLPTYSWLKVGDEFVLQDFNDAAEAVTDGKIRDGLGSAASDWYAYHPEILVDLQTCLAEQRTLRRELLYRYRTTGLQRQLAFSFVFVPPRTVMLHSEDVTQARQAEQQREAMAQSEKLRALGQMATGIAHDLNQSLMLVASYSDLARQALVQDPPNLTELEDLLTTTTQAALDGGETVKRLLVFTRVAPDQDSKRVDLSSVVRDAAQLTAPRWRDAAQAEGRPISLHIEAEGHPTIQGSPARLRELLTNLIFNAVDALPTGGTIRLRVVAEDGQGIVEVIDSGVGMSAEVQERVFEPFFTTKGEGGTGLGLAMVFGIVEQHGGHIEVRSTPGSGTTLCMRFPLAGALAEAEQSPRSSVQLEPPRPLRVLAVDDEPMITRAVVRMLKPSGHVVSVAGSGEEAIEKLAEQPFDVVVSDMGMGAGMNGWELADMVRVRWPGVRFLLATGWGAAIDPVEARTRGVEAVLAKPYQLADLLYALVSTDIAA